MTRLSIVGFAAGALAIGLIATGTAFAVTRPDEARIVTPVSMNADAGPTPSLGPTDGPADGPTDGPTIRPTTDPSDDRSDDSGNVASDDPSDGPTTEPGDDRSDDRSNDRSNDRASGTASPSPRGSDDSDDSLRVVPVPGGVTLDRARAIALGTVGGTVRETKLDDEDGRTVWEVELTGRDGAKWEVTLDAATGRVLETERY